MATKHVTVCSTSSGSRRNRYSEGPEIDLNTNASVAAASGESMAGCLVIYTQFEIIVLSLL